MTTVAAWDEWFAAVGDEETTRAWASAKSVFGADPVKLDRWATIIDLNRVDRLITANEKTPHSGVPCGVELGGEG